MISIKDYAQSCGVSYEAIRKKLTQYREELDGHIMKQGRTQYLDDYAVEFLDKHRDPQRVVQHIQADEYTKMLEFENKELLRKIAEQADMISALSREKADNAVLIASAEANKLLLDTTKSELKELREELPQKLEAAKTEGRKAAEEHYNKELEPIKAERDSLKIKNEKLMNRNAWERLINKEV